MLSLSLVACGTGESSNQSGTAVTSVAESDESTPTVGDIPFTDYLVQTIENNVETDIAKIVPDKAYPLDYDGTADQVKSEIDNDKLPTFSLDVNPEEYDTVFLGYPIC